MLVNSLRNRLASLSPLQGPYNLISVAFAHDQPFTFNYNRINDTVFFGSAPNTVDKVDELKAKGVQLIVNVQPPKDETELKIDIKGVIARSKEIGIKHVWVPSPGNLTPEQIIKVLKETVRATGGKTEVAYFHCTHGVARGPSFGLAHLYWLQGQPLTKAFEDVKKIRFIKPFTESVQEATKLLLGQDNIDFNKPLTEEQRAAILKKLME